MAVNRSAVRVSHRPRSAALSRRPADHCLRRQVRACAPAFARFVLRRGSRRALSATGGAKRARRGALPALRSRSGQLRNLYPSRQWHRLFPIRGCHPDFRRIGRSCGGLASLCRLCPRPLRDALYDFVARNRLRWFGARADLLRSGPITGGPLPFMTSRLNVLIVGGYGIFGGRLVELLENEPRLTLLRRRSLHRQSAAPSSSREPMPRPS